MKETKVKKWYKIFTSSKFLDEKYQEDKAKVIAKYTDKGYRDAKIVSDTVFKHDEKQLISGSQLMKGNNIISATSHGLEISNTHLTF